MQLPPLTACPSPQDERTISHQDRSPPNKRSPSPIANNKQYTWVLHEEPKKRQKQIPIPFKYSKYDNPAQEPSCAICSAVRTIQWRFTVIDGQKKKICNPCGMKIYKERRTISWLPSSPVSERMSIKFFILNQHNEKNAIRKGFIIVKGKKIAQVQQSQLEILALCTTLQQIKNSDST